MTKKKGASSEKQNFFKKQPKIMHERPIESKRKLKYATE